MKTETAMAALAPRSKPNVKDMIDEIREAVRRADALDFFERMEQNHWHRHNWWENQTWDGRKKCPEGGDPRTIFPWENASDCRVNLIDEIIGERVDGLMAAYDLARFNVGPRELSPDEAKQNKAVLWGSVARYYQDEQSDEFRTAAQQLADWAEEFGHAVMYVGWTEERQLEKRSIAVADLEVMVTQAVLAAAEARKAQEMEAAGMGMPADGGSVLTPGEQDSLARSAVAEVSDLVADPDMQGRLVALLLEYDPDMPEREARRVTSELRMDGDAEYFAPYVSRSVPCWRALLPYVDVIYPPEIRTMQKAPWVAMPEWLTAQELADKVANEGWSQKFVDELLEHKGVAFDFGNTFLQSRKWVNSGGLIGTGVATGNEAETAPLYQVMHVYYRAEAMGGVSCAYHTVISGWVSETAALHEAVPYSHGALPFRERCREVKAKTLVQSRGVGEITFTDQREIKVQRDMRCDNASMQLLPPAEVPLLRAGGDLPLLRPGVQIPTPRLTGAGGSINWLRPPGAPASSEKIEQDIRLSVDAYWARGQSVLPEVALTRARVRTTHFLSDLKEVWRLTFKLIQEYAPDEIRASCIGGLPVDLSVSRSEIQGQVSLGLTFDPADLNMDMVMSKLKVLNEALLPLDRTGALNTYNILRAAVSAVMPQWLQEVMPKTEQAVLQSEMEDEDRILGQLLLGLEQPYIPGKDHGARLSVIQKRLTATNEDGTPIAAQRIMQANPDVQALVENRVKFHQFQLDQQQNANTGRLGVEPQQAA